MKHLLNNLSEEEKNAIREQHAGGIKIMTESFRRLTNSKLGDVRTLVESTNIKLPKVGDRLRISNLKNFNQSYMGEVVKIFNNYIIHLKNGQKCAQYIWETEGITMKSEGSGFHITDPNFELNFKIKPC